jgi:predicted DNA-binding transcriptional regulator YafY
MAEQQKLKRLLLMLDMLQPPGSTLHEIADELGIVKRTAERYVHLLREANFHCEKDKLGRYYLFEPFRKGFTLNLNEEESAYLYDLLVQTAGQNPLSRSIRGKMIFRQTAHKRIKNRFRLHLPELIEKLAEAMRNNQQVEIESYYSAYAGQSTQRQLEPLKFTDNYMYLIAYEARVDRVVNLKMDRIQDVRILEIPRTRPDIAGKVDVFYMAGNDESHEISLLLTSLAYRLLLEEYPETEPYLEESGDERYPFRFRATVYSFLPIGRFCLGLPGALLVERPEAFRIYLRKKMQDFTW